MADDCALCPSSLFYYRHSESGPTREERHELFHQSCPACSPVKAQDQSLCDLCQHLRLEHLIRCVEPEKLREFLFPLRKGLADTSMKRLCPLCRMVNHMFVIGLSGEQLFEIKGVSYDTLLYLGPPHDPESGASSILSADIYASYRECGGTSNVWVGDLHISDTSKVSAMSPVGEMIFWPSLESTINECYESHEECRYEVKSCLPKGFRVIDVMKRCLVERTDCRFFALSYVWGVDFQSSLFAASSVTIGRMKNEGGLPALGMPRTIEDAMKVCVLMGQRYLWADRLCIIQDDDEDKKNQIDAMNDIFSSAQLVLIAAYGDSMDFGIPGVGHPRKVVQHQVDILDLRLTNVIREVTDDPLDLWHTRGWTYQEAVLSRRRLYFANTRAFFECEQLICHEDQFNVETNRNEFFSTRLTIPEDHSHFQSFARHLTHCTRRKLTYRSDAYDAVNGILKSLYDGESALENGLPRLDFDRALLWYPHIGKNSITRLETAKAALPTWSWSSAVSLSDQVRYHETSFYGSLVIWYVITGQSSPGSIEVANMQSDLSKDDDWQIYMAVACSNGCVENASLPISLKTHSFSTMRVIFNTYWKGYSVLGKEKMLLAIHETRYSNTTNSGIMHDTKPGVIITKCQTASLRLAAKSSRYSVDIINSEEERIGELCGEAAKIREKVTSSEYDTSKKLEFGAISLSGRMIRDYDIAELETKRVFDTDGNSLNKVPVVNVLMISWKGSVAHRQALGWIFLVDWVKLCREWKIIMLE